MGKQYKPQYDKDKMLTKDELIGCPCFIVDRYTIMYNYIGNGDSFGALLKAKDIFELCLKVPVNIMFSFIESYIMNKENESSKIDNKLKSKLLSMFKKLPSFGDWEDMACFFSKDDVNVIPFDTRTKVYYKPLRELLEKLISIYYNPKPLKKSDNYKISTWRNELIGHGSTSEDKESIKIEVQKCTKIINEILMCYSQSDITIAKCLDDHCIEKYFIDLKSRNVQDVCEKIVVNPYVSIVAAVFDSYDIYRHRAKLLDYDSSNHEFSNDLTLRIEKLLNKLGFKEASGKAINNFGFTKKDLEEINDQLNVEVYPYEGFYKYVANFLRYTRGGTLLLTAKRGAGKTVFADTISTVNKRSNIKLANKNFLPQNYFRSNIIKNDDELLVWTYHFSSTLPCGYSNFLSEIYEFLKLDALNYDDFEETYNDVKKAYKECTNLLGNDKVKKELDDNIKAIQEKFKRFIESGYKIIQNTHENKIKKLVIVLDGLDEINHQKPDCTRVNWLLNSDVLAEVHGVYFVMLCREDEDYKLPDELKSCAKIIERQDENSYNDYLLDYIKTKNKESNGITNDKVIPFDNRDMKRLVELADQRMVHLNLIMHLYPSLKKKNILSEEMSTVDFLRAFFEEKEETSYMNSKALKKMLFCLAVVPRPLTIDEFIYLCDPASDDSFISTENSITSEFLVKLSQIRGFVKVSREHNKSTLYSLANEIWTNALLSDVYAKDFELFKNELAQRAKNLFEELCSNPQSIRDEDVLLLSITTVVYDSGNENSKEGIVKYIDKNYSSRLLSDDYKEIIQQILFSTRNSDLVNNLFSKGYVEENYRQYLPIAESKKIKSLGNFNCLISKIVKNINTYINYCSDYFDVEDIKRYTGRVLTSDEAYEKIFGWKFTNPYQAYFFGEELLKIYIDLLNDADEQFKNENLLSQIIDVYIKELNFCDLKSCINSLNVVKSLLDNTPIGETFVDRMKLYIGASKRLCNEDVKNAYEEAQLYFNDFQNGINKIINRKIVIKENEKEELFKQYLNFFLVNEIIDFDEHIALAVLEEYTKCFVPCGINSCNIELLEIVNKLYLKISLSENSFLNNRLEKYFDSLKMFDNIPLNIGTMFCLCELREKHTDLESLCSYEEVLEYIEITYPVVYIGEYYGDEFGEILDVKSREEMNILKEKWSKIKDYVNVSHNISIKNRFERLDKFYSNTVDYWDYKGNLEYAQEAYERWCFDHPEYTSLEELNSCLEIYISAALNGNSDIDDGEERNYVVECCSSWFKSVEMLSEIQDLREKSELAKEYYMRIESSTSKLLSSVYGYCDCSPFLTLANFYSIMKCSYLVGEYDSLKYYALKIRDWLSLKNIGDSGIQCIFDTNRYGDGLNSKLIGIWLDFIDTLIACDYWDDAISCCNILVDRYTKTNDANNLSTNANVDNGISLEFNRMINSVNTHMREKQLTEEIKLLSAKYLLRDVIKNCSDKTSGQFGDFIIQEKEQYKYREICSYDLMVDSMTTYAN